MWLSGLSAGLWTKGSPVQFPVRAHAWLWARFPAGGAGEATTYWCFSPCLSPSLPPLSKNKPNKILKKEKKKRVVKLKDLKIALKKMLDEDHINNWFRQMSMSMLKSHWLKVCGVVNKLHDLKVLLNKLLTDYKGMGTWRASLTCPLMWQNKKYLPPLQYSW